MTFPADIGSHHEAALAEYAHLLERCYDAASQTDEQTTCDFTIAGYAVRFEGEASYIACLTRAFAHLARTATAVADFTIYCWSGTPPPISFPLWLKQQGYARGTAADLMRQIASSRGIAPSVRSQRFRLFVKPWPSRVAVLDLHRNVAFSWIEAAEQVPPHEQRIPLRNLFGSWMSERARVLLHAGAVGTADSGALIVGESGAGKTSTALACLDHGLHYAADDYCLAAIAPQPRIYSLYNTLQVKQPADLNPYALLRDLPQKHQRENEGKVWTYLHEVAPTKIGCTFPLKAILIPQITKQNGTRLVEVGAARAIQALAPSTVRQIPATGQATLLGMADLAQRVPCFVCEVGSDRRLIAQEIATFLKHV